MLSKQEIAKLPTELRDWAARHSHRLSGEAADAIDQLQRENAELRKALTPFVDGLNQCDHPLYVENCTACFIRKQARAVLKPV